MHIRYYTIDRIKGDILRMAKKTFKFADHNEIPAITVEYILGVVDADGITEVSLDDINDFLNGLEADAE